MLLLNIAFTLIRVTVYMAKIHAFYWLFSCYFSATITQNTTKVIKFEKQASREEFRHAIIQNFPQLENTDFDLLRCDKQRNLIVFPEGCDKPADIVKVWGGLGRSHIYLRPRSDIGATPDSANLIDAPTAPKRVRLSLASETEDEDELATPSAANTICPRCSRTVSIDGGCLPCQQDDDYQESLAADMAKNTTIQSARINDDMAAKVSTEMTLYFCCYTLDKKKWYNII